MKEKCQKGLQWTKQNAKIIGYCWLGVTLVYAILNKLYLTTDNIVVYGETKIVNQVETVSVSKVIVMFLAYSFSVFVINWKNKLSPKMEKIAIILITAFSPLITFMFVELTFQSELLQMEKYAIFFNLFIIGFFSWVFIVTCNRFHQAIMIPLAAWFIFQIANLYVTRFRGFSLLMSDFTLIESAMTVASSYDYMISYKMLIMLIALVDFFIIICKLDNIKFFDKKARVVAVFSAFVYCGLFYWVTMESDLISEPKIHISQYKPQKSYSKNGTALTLFGSMQFLQTEKPENYNEENLDSLMKKYVSDSAKEFDIDNAPNVIVIMDEAFSDYETLYNLDTSEETLPFFNSLKENVVEGNMYVSIHGGQTANTEYEFLTGNSKAFLPYGVAPYQSYLKKDVVHLSLARSFKAMGYEQELALHSYGASGYNRTAAYTALGFDEFYTKDNFENPLFIRKFISDYSHFEKIIELYEDNKKNYNSPFFMFNVTMQNHSSYSDLFDNFPLTINVNNPEYAQKTTLKTYFNLIKETENAYK